MAKGVSTTSDSLSIGLGYLIKTRNASDALGKIYFKNTEVTYRDDNRSIWLLLKNLT